MPGLQRIPRVLPGMPAWLNAVFLFGMIGFLPAHFFPFSGKAINNLFYVMVGVPVLAAAVLSWRRWREWAAGLEVLGAFMLAMALSTLALGDLVELKPILYVATFCVGVAFFARAAPRLVERTYLGFALVGVGTLAVAAVQWIGSFREQGHSVRIFTLEASGDPNLAALLIVSGLAYLWVFVLDRRVADRRLHLAGTVSLFGCALMAVVSFESRSALLGFLAFACCYGVFRGYLKLLAGIFVAALVLVVALGLDDALLQRGLSYRPEIWMDALGKLYRECSLVFGCGADSNIFVTQYHGTHSIYVGTLYRYGLVGALGMAAFLVFYFMRGFRTRSDWFLVSLVGWASSLTILTVLAKSPASWWVYLWFPTVTAMVLDFRGPSREAGAAGRSSSPAPPSERGRIAV